MEAKFSLEPLVDENEQLASFAMLLADAMESEGACIDVYIPAARLLADLAKENSNELRRVYRELSK